MILQPISTKQPRWEAWSLERLVHKIAIALGHALETSTTSTYESHLQSYLTFCHNHHFPIEPTNNTLSFYMVYMCHHLKPSTVSTYLSGSCHLLEPYYPNVCKACSSPMVTHSLAGMKKLHGLQPTNHKCALTCEDLITIFRLLSSNPAYNDHLFMAMLITGFFGLLRLGELTLPDNIRKHSFKKVTMRHTLSLETSCFSFTLPYDKVDRTTALALAGVTDNAIQAMGHWSLDTWHIYIRKHPVRLQALMHNHSAFQTPSSTTTHSSLPNHSRK
ncbi:hypothetical protein M422DRAFT_177471 [Sphaerobolus stellatus SS14]|uniref:Uncharacterized protein n=1 Tax=Sphaerobolus stellatus (strain SS14) TaxID=990650 RepID=A0A0C9U4H9_SPHS4|nr:hypothetical protein M422DRAFT_177471 [Sphaerobolus stellatus SS14]